MRRFNRSPSPPRVRQPAPSRTAAAARFDRQIGGSAAVRSARSRVQQSAEQFASLPVSCCFHWEKLDTQGHSMDEIKRGQARAEQEFVRAFVNSAREGFLGVPSWLRPPLPEGFQLTCAWDFGGLSWYDESLESWRDYHAAQKNGYSAGRALALGMPQEFED